MPRSPLARVMLLALACVAWLALASTALAAGGARSTGRVALSLPGGASGPLVLQPGQGGWVGQLTVSNLGTEPLVVSRVAIRGDEDDVRSPSRLSARFVDGAATSATLAPGASKDVVVSWMPEKDPRQRQAFGHVIVTSTDEQAGEVAMGFRAAVPTGLGWLGEHALSLLVLLPWLVVLVAGAARLAGRADGPLVRPVALGVGLVQLALALWVWWRFVPDVGHADGNDGFQLVERSVWVRSVGAEWYLGVDGASVGLVVLASGIALVALAVARPDRRSDAYHATMALLASGIVAVLVALDLALLFAAWQVVLVALVMLLGGWGGARGGHAAAKLGIYGALGSAAMLAAFVALSNASGRTLLVDGAAVAHTLSVPELARTSFAARGPILGVPFVDMAWTLLLVPVAVAAPIVPLHGWLPEALEEAPPGAGIVLAGLFTALGPYLLVRVGLGAMPEGARWAGPALAALGVFSAAYGALCAMAQRDLRRFVAYATLASAGACVYGVGALTAQGIAGALAGLFAHGLAAALLLGAAGALEKRVRTCALSRLGGLATETPRLAAMVGVGLALSLGVPVLAGFWGPLLVLMGGFGRHPVMAVALAWSFVALAASHLRVARSMLLGRLDPAWNVSPLLESYGGKLPDATPGEIAALVPVILVALLLGVWPVPLLAPMGAAVHDTSAALEPTSHDAVP
jgi:NADH-quinone oxidoreductase subunit M